MQQQRHPVTRRGLRSAGDIDGVRLKPTQVFGLTRGRLGRAVQPALVREVRSLSRFEVACEDPVYRSGLRHPGVVGYAAGELREVHVREELRDVPGCERGTLRAIAPPRGIRDRLGSVAHRWHRLVGAKREVEERGWIGRRPSAAGMRGIGGGLRQQITAVRAVPQAHARRQAHRALARVPILVGNIDLDLAAGEIDVNRWRCSAHRGSAARVHQVGDHARTGRVDRQEQVGRRRDIGAVGEREHLPRSTADRYREPQQGRVLERVERDAEGRRRG